MKKQSSVEWYADEEHNLFISYQKGFMSTARYILLKHNLQKQAKEMHRNEIEDAFEFGTNNGVAHCHGHQLEKPIEYFNDTFNQ